MSIINGISASDSVNAEDLVIEDKLQDAIVKNVSVSAFSQLVENSEAKVVNKNIAKDLEAHQAAHAQMNKTAHYKNTKDAVTAPLQNIASFSKAQ